MQIHNGIIHLPVFNHAVLTIGTFDGVHAGHRIIINRIVQMANKRGGESVLITFEPHPRLLLQPNHPLKLISTLDEKSKLLASLGVDHLVVAPFTMDFANLSPEAYIEDFLVKTFNPSVLVIGYDHHFGNERKGNYRLLEKYAANGYFGLEEISQQLIDDVKVSSTIIRNELEKGNIKTVNNLLQSNYSLSGMVIQGKQNGRLLGYPTANMKLLDRHKLIPKNGVYAVQVHHEEMVYNGVMNIGKKPTFNQGAELSLEVHILSFDRDIYNEKIQVYFLDRLRAEQKFESLEVLKDQIARDIGKANALF